MDKNTPINIHGTHKVHADLSIYVNIRVSWRKYLPNNLILLITLD